MKQTYNMTVSNSHLEYDICQKRRFRGSSCTSRTGFIFTTVFLAALCIALIALILIHVFVTPLYKEKEEICGTKDCTVTASLLIQSMDQSVDPCTNFYQFACGGYIRRNPIPNDGNTADVFEQHKIDVIHQLNDVIRKANAAGQPKIIGKAQQAYFVCVNGSHNEEGEFRAFKSFVRKQLGGWPIATGPSWKFKEKSLEEYLGKVMRMGYSIELLNIKIGADMLDPSMKRIMFEKPTVDIMASKTFRRRKRDIDHEGNLVKTVQARFAFITSLASIMGNTSTPTSIKDDFHQMIELEYDLSQLTGNGHEPKNYSQLYNKMTLNEVNKLTQKKLDWVKVLNAMFEKQPAFTGNDEVVVTSVDYMTKLAGIAGNYSIRTIVNSIIWKIIYNLAEHAGPKIDKLLYQYQKSAHGFAAETPRWNLCISWVNDVFAFAVTRLFVEDYVDKNSIKTANNYVELILKAFRRNVEKSQWLDEETKRPALIKADLMKRYIGYPEFIFNDEHLEKFFSYISNIGPVHFTNVVNVATETIKEFLETYVKPMDKEIWTENPTDVNAFYEAQTNSIWFPAGVLNQPFFDNNRLAAVNFGIIGSLIGHEIGHGFDNEGSQFDETGQLRQWWSSKSLTGFLNRTQCYINQYDNYCPTEVQSYRENPDISICVNGNNTLAENIADNTGVQCAYDAYKMWIKKNGEEKKLPGLEEYSPHQIFFLSFAYMWCENVNPEFWSIIYEDDAHSSGEYRVIGSLANMEEFARVFQCNKGPMNRADQRCTLW